MSVTSEGRQQWIASSNFLSDYKIFPPSSSFVTTHTVPLLPHPPPPPSLPHLELSLVHMRRDKFSTCSKVLTLMLQPFLHSVSNVPYSVWDRVKFYWTGEIKSGCPSNLYNIPKFRWSHEQFSWLCEELGKKMFFQVPTQCYLVLQTLRLERWHQLLLALAPSQKKRKT